MDYHKHISEIRDSLHRDLVQEACHKNFIINDNSDGVLQLHDPTYIRIKEEMLLLVSIDCESGLPTVETYQGNFRAIRYGDLSVEELIDLHKRVVQQKQYSFTPHNELV
jgi:hypothetical protein